MRRGHKIITFQHNVPVSVTPLPPPSTPGRHEAWVGICGVFDSLPYLRGWEIHSVFFALPSLRGGAIFKGERFRNESILEILEIRTVTGAKVAQVL